MADPTPQEILSWALINRARLDPAGEAADYGINVNEGPVRDFNGNVVTITAASKQPLAWNSSLFAVADQHSQDMLTQQQMYHNNQQTHEANLRNAGYSFSWWGENVSQQPVYGAIDATQAIYLQHQSLFVDTYSSWRGHRYNMLNDNFQEIGVGQAIGTFNGTTSSLITQDFGRPATAGQFLTGIAYNDTDANAFYSVGEGRGGISVATSAGTAVTASAGNYSLAIGAGTQTITFSGGNLAAPVTVTANITAGRNALIDLVDQSTVETSVSLTAGNGVSKIIGLGNLGLTLTGNGVDNTIVSALGNDTLDGAGGIDTAVFSGNRANYTITTNANGTVTVAGLDGTDTLVSIEKAQFKDQLVVLSGGATAGSVAISDVMISEGDAGTKVVTFTVVRSGGTAAFNVNYATADGSATTADGDYVASSNTLQFAANEMSKTFSVVINGDTKVEANETFNVNLSGATNGATISDAQGVGTITNDDAAGSVAISDVMISEGDAGTKVVTFTVVRSGGTAAFNVNYATADGSATTADGDYVASSNTLQFAANETSKTFSVVINGDTKVEANETFNVNLSGATNGATISDAQGVGTITNDDAAAVAGSVAISDVMISEGDAGTKVVTFTVVRSGGTAAFNVNYATADGSATTADGDYVASSNTLQFAANETSKTFSVVINGDTKAEANETFNVNLSGATNGATISDAQGVGTITNDDAAAVAGSVAIGDVMISEGNSGTKVATFTVVRSGGTAAFNVNYATAGGSATTADGDYVANSNTLQFVANEMSKTFSVVINGDTKVEANETFNVNLSGATNGATISDAQGVGTITNDDVGNATQITGTEGDDVLVGEGASNVTFHGLGGNDLITDVSSGNFVFGDNGGDQLYFQGDQNQLYGGEGNDWLGVNGNNNALVGGAGDECWIGASGNGNTLAGGDGGDALFANGTGNYLYGENGNDWLGVSGSQNRLFGGAGSEWMGASGNNNLLFGGEGGDTLFSVGANALYGETGDDWIGCSGNGNVLNGAQGNDYLAASGNNNTLDGGAGNDILLAGGAHGGDRFVFHAGYGMDTVVNFSRHGAGGSDVVDLNGFGLNFSSLQGYMADVGGNCVITLDAATVLTIDGISKAQLQANDFWF